MPRHRSVLTATAALGAAGLALASSHREAPFVTENPKVDATDFYLFSSYEPGREDFVTVVANYQPLQDPYGGPNYFTMDPDAVYQIHLDNDGDSVEDLTFQFTFGARPKNIALPVGPPGQEVMVPVALRNVAPISATDSGGQNDLELYSVWLVEGPVDQSTSVTQITEPGSTDRAFAKPIDNIGTKSIPDYEAYADAFTYDIQLPDGSVGRMFVGQRKDPFVVNLGETFDLVNYDPLGPVDGQTDSLADKNVTSLILELPKSFVRGTGSVVGGWTTATLPRTTSLVDDPTYSKPTQSSGDRVQVSRLGMPLVNELVIGLPDKNRFNASQPSDDAQFLDYVTNPTLPELLEALFGVQAPELFPRVDLFSVFLTGLGGLNDNGAVSEMIRLNMDITATPAAVQDNLGVVGGDLAGFPNGRRPGDDVVDIELRVVMGALLDPGVAPDGLLPYTDGAFVDSSFFDETFPYLRTPIPGSPE